MADTTTIPTATQDRTNVTPTGYTFGGNQYQTETRTDANGQGYKVDVQQAPAVVAAPTTPPTGGNGGNPVTINSMYGPNTGGGYDTASKEYESYLADPTAYLTGKGVSEADMKNKALAAMQASIDATNAMYGEKLRQARVTGAGTLGQNTAIQARRGMLGSDFGAAATDTVNATNDQIYSSIEEERNAKVNALRADAQTNADKMFADKRAALEGNLKDRLTYMKGKDERNKTQAEAAAASLIAQGIDPTTLDAAHMTALTDPNTGYGVSSDAIMAAYKAAKYTSDKAVKDDATKRANTLSDQTALEKFKSELKAKENVSLSEGQALYDATGKRIAFNPKTYAPKAADPSTVPLTPEGKTAKLNQLTNIKNLISKVETLADRSGSDTLWEKTKQAVGGATSYTNLVAQTNSLRVQAMTVLTDPNNKKFFGPAMSNADVQLMMAGGNPINPELQTPAEMRESLKNLTTAVAEIEANIKSGKITEVPVTPAATPATEQPSQIMHNGVLYDVDANGDLTPAA